MLGAGAIGLLILAGTIVWVLMGEWLAACAAGMFLIGYVWVWRKGLL